MDLHDVVYFIVAGAALLALVGLVAGAFVVGDQCKGFKYEPLKGVRGVVGHTAQGLLNMVVMGFLFAYAGAALGAFVGLGLVYPFCAVFVLLGVCALLYGVHRLVRHFN